VKPFKGIKDPAFTERSGMFFTTNSKLQTHVKTADGALKLEVAERLKLIETKTVQKDEEEAMEEEEDVVDELAGLDRKYVFFLFLW
jgi:hypothetical protein